MRQSRIGCGVPNQIHDDLVTYQLFASPVFRDMTKQLNPDEKFPPESCGSIASCSLLLQHTRRRPRTNRESLAA
jgi:hypothetical protein